ncbi:MAG TPA: DUF2628 domain-containing protein [Spirochaetota bacterium]|nr:DUF2628 domain-containing protein [Spirochaetota bacterium]
MTKTKQTGGKSENEYMEIFVGKNYSYYQKKWSGLESRRSMFSFNLPALLIFSVWAAYRKMYQTLIIFTGFILVLWLIEAPSSIYIGFFFILSLMSNSIYRIFVKRKISQISKEYKTRDIPKILEEKGGTCTASAILMVIINVSLAVRSFIDFIDMINQ